jgi:hypothetical protein
MGGNRVSRFRRAAIFARAIARDPRPQDEWGAENLLMKPCVGCSFYGRYTISREGYGWHETFALDRQQQGRPVSHADPGAPRCRLCALCCSARREACRRQGAEGFGDAGVLEVIARHDGDTFRAVYTVRLADVVYVLHVFQKKSKRGIATPKKEVDLIR